uniref:Uncharacterized protein n=1 Tax=Anguilla anguilla TaxID=7936 RepID=A0A0E9QHY2_ANGAN
MLCFDSASLFLYSGHWLIFKTAVHEPAPSAVQYLCQSCLLNKALTDV